MPCPFGTFLLAAGWNAGMMARAGAAIWAVTWKPHAETEEVSTLKHFANPGLTTPDFLLREKETSVFFRLLLLLSFLTLAAIWEICNNSFFR